MLYLEGVPTILDTSILWSLHQHCWQTGRVALTIHGVGRVPDAQHHNNHPGDHNHDLFDGRSFLASFSNVPFPNPLRKPPFAALARRWPRYGSLVANQEGSSALGASFAAMAALTQAIVFLLTFPITG